jgi:YD repeat-containing protein
VPAHSNDCHVTTTTDQAGNARRYTYDVMGRMTQVEEPNPSLSTPLVTAYTYL